MTQRGLGGLPKPEPGELTVADVVSTTGYSGTWVRKLAEKSDGLPSRAVQHGKRMHHFFQPADIEAHMEGHRSGPRRRSAGVPSPPPTEEVRYLRGQIEKLQADRERLQGELTRGKVDWSAGEARLDELRRTCDRQAETIARLTDAIREAGQPPMALGN